MRIPLRKMRSVNIYDPISKSGEINAVMRFIFSLLDLGGGERQEEEGIADNRSVSGAGLEIEGRVHLAVDWTAGGHRAGSLWSRTSHL